MAPGDLVNDSHGDAAGTGRRILQRALAPVVQTERKQRQTKADHIMPTGWGMSSRMACRPVSGPSPTCMSLPILSAPRSTGA